MAELLWLPEELKEAQAESELPADPEIDTRELWVSVGTGLAD